MSVEIKALSPVPGQLRPFVKFGNELYAGSPYYVPSMVMDDMQTLNPKKNPAYEYCRSQAFMAYRDGRPVGRITGIINNQVNERTGQKSMRFGFLDFIDDDEVSEALFKAASEWGRRQGMDSMVGPLGFTDMDHEGMLTEGFEEMGTMATLYNYPYYPAHMERTGYGKEVDWIEFRMTVPDAIPEKYKRIADIVARKYNLSVKKFTSRKKIKQEYGHALFELINEAYTGLYGYSPLTERQIDYYIDMYLGVIRLEDVCLIVDGDGKLVAVGISMPSLSQALRRSGGKLFPTGWYHLWKAIRGKVDVVDLLLVAVKPEYQSKGVNAMIFADLIPVYVKNGYKYAESNIELEGNENVQKQWEYFEYRQHRRRRAWSKNL